MYRTWWKWMDGEKKLPDVSHILRLSSFIHIKRENNDRKLYFVVVVAVLLLFPRDPNGVWRAQPVTRTTLIVRIERRLNGQEEENFFFHPGVYCSGSILVQAAGAHETIDNALGERKRRKKFFFFLRSRESFLLLLFSRDFAGAMWTRIIRHVDCRSA